MWMEAPDTSRVCSSRRKVVLPCKVLSTEHTPGSNVKQVNGHPTRLPISHQGLHHCLTIADGQTDSRTCKFRWSYVHACGACRHNAAQHMHGTYDAGLVVATRLRASAGRRGGTVTGAKLDHKVPEIGPKAPSLVVERALGPFQLVTAVELGGSAWSRICR
jgi:hypothetical protein